jgi:purine-binding chemotaxis protein CheW
MSDRHIIEALEDYFSSLLTESAPFESAATKPHEVVQASIVEPRQPEVLNVAPVQTTRFERPAAISRARPLAELLEMPQPDKAKPLAEFETTLPQVLPVFRSPEPEVQAPVTRPEPVIVEPVVVPQEVTIPVVIEEAVVEPEQEAAQAPQVEPEPTWENIETENDFQVLFFEVAGVTFGVPLTELGGIHRMTEVSPLFGKPDWFAGIMLQRDEKLTVVDTIKWVMPGQNIDADSKYLVMLGETSWGLSCERLLGTERLSKDDVKWRGSPGKRPWLAGMVKQRMCALIHVHEFIALLDKGVNIEGS